MTVPFGCRCTKLCNAWAWFEYVYSVCGGGWGRLRVFGGPPGGGSGLLVREPWHGTRRQASSFNNLRQIKAWAAGQCGCWLQGRGAAGARRPTTHLPLSITQEECRVLRHLRGVAVPSKGRNFDAHWAWRWLTYGCLGGVTLAGRGPSPLAGLQGLQVVGSKQQLSNPHQLIAACPPGKATPQNPHQLIAARPPRQVERGSIGVLVACRVAQADTWMCGTRRDGRCWCMYCNVYMP